MQQHVATNIIAESIVKAGTTPTSPTWMQGEGGGGGRLRRLSQLRPKEAKGNANPVPDHCLTAGPATFVESSIHPDNPSNDTPPATRAVNRCSSSPTHIIEDDADKEVERDAEEIDYGGAQLLRNICAA